VLGKQTLIQLGKKYEKSVPTVQKYFAALNFAPRMLPPCLHPVSLTCDTTFFGRKYGVLVFRAQGKTLWWRFVSSESAEETRLGLEELLQAGWRFHGITVDGKKSVLAMLGKYYPELPVQLCQFHLMQNIRRLLRHKPKTSLEKEVLALVNRLTTANQEEFTERFLYLTLRKYRDEISLHKERDAKRAIKAIQQSLPYLFTCQQYPQRNIPNTTNSCEGHFGQWKGKIKLHRGIKNQHQKKMISFLLAQ
jgi:hypothetical protein